MELQGNFLLSKLVVNMTEALRGETKIDNSLLDRFHDIISLDKRKGQRISNICSESSNQY